jgi:hypothetical protein
LYHALNILPSYPYDTHVEVVLHELWGGRLPEMRLRARELYDMSFMLSRKTYLDCNYTLQHVTFELAGLSASVNAYPIGPLADPSLHLLLPSDGDTFNLREENGEQNLYLQHGTGGTYSCDRTVPGYDKLLAWTLVLQERCIDLIEADKLLHRVSATAKRSRDDVIRSVYPTARSVFPSLSYSKRPAIPPAKLRMLIHPADQAMLRTVLDQSAAGMSMPDNQKPLRNLSLAYVN